MITSLDSAKIFDGLAKAAFEQCDYGKVLELTRGRGSLMSVRLTEMVAVSAYWEGVRLAANGQLSVAHSQFAHAEQLSHDPTLRRLCRDRMSILKHACDHPHIEESDCPLCTNNKAVCGVAKLHCQGLRPEIDAVFCLGAYRSGWDRDRGNKFSRMLRGLKEPDGRIYLQPAAQLLAHFVAKHIDAGTRAQVELIFPVPTVKDRLKRRGFAIPLALATGVAYQMGVPVYRDLISMTRDTTDLRGLSQSARFKELDGAFTAVDFELIKSRTIMVVDDIITYGTTMKEIGRVLRKAGASGVIGVALAHTESS